MVQWVVGLILHGEPIERFLIPRSEMQLRGNSIRLWWDGSSDRSFMVNPLNYFSFQGVRCSSVVRAFAHGAMGRQIDPSW